MNVFKGVEFTPLYPRNVADLPTFEANAKGCALNNSDHVVIYDINTTNFMAGRAWWMFKVGVNLQSAH